MRPDPPLRLTRRGRVVLFVLCLLLAGLVTGLVASASQASSHLAAPLGLTVLAGPAEPFGSASSTSSVGHPEETVVVVRPGDTLWSIAAQHAPSRDPYGIIEEIRRRNDLPDHTIHAGQELTLP